MKPGVLALLLAVPLCAQVKFTQSPGKIDIEIDGKPFSTFYSGGDAPKPYLAPLRSADGIVVTRRFPMESVEGESKDHPHHRGLWFTHGDVNGVDFWMNEPGNPGKHGTITLNSPEQTKGGRKSGTIKASYTWKLDDGKPILREDRLMTFYSDPAQRMIDFEMTLTALEIATFGDTKEGFFAIRLRDELSESRGTGKMTSAENKSGMKLVWGKKSAWVDYSGALEGKKLGVTILDHPQNPRHPTYWHSRDYGLFAANAFGEHDFLNDKSRDGSLTIRQAQNLRFCYRVIIHPGDFAAVNPAEWFDQYSRTVKK